MICFRMARISDCISDSGLAAAGSLESGGGSTNLMSKTHLSSGIRESLEMMASTSWVTAPVSNHSWQALVSLNIDKLPTYSELD